jgi:hypothetical protein
VQAEQHAAVEREHGVVERTRLLVLVEHRVGAEQTGVPGSAAFQVRDRDGDVLKSGKGHRQLLR